MKFSKRDRESAAVYCSARAYDWTWVWLTKPSELAYSLGVSDRAFELAGLALEATPLTFLDDGRIDWQGMWGEAEAKLRADNWEPD